MAAGEYSLCIHPLFTCFKITHLGGLAESSVFWNATSYPEVLREDHKILKVRVVLKTAEMSNIILFKLD